MLLLIWFFTCKHWWYHVILVPVSMYSYQVVSTVYDDVFIDSNFLDNDQLVYLAPFFIVILCIVYLIRIKIFDRIYGLDDLSELEETEISVFSNVSERDRREIKSFQQEVENDETGDQEIILEDYYRKL
ncbi:hypothetical protein [Autumnicola psychrophila]|uniref:Uncharacterized protein n=1 Tax=Autumnicola psychrophila TaxID=3075592 RepID=A0ABU3DPJ9_9FLAO|nr:hypothetical protein [Zunongwangia sp. F225]MDT0685636.1 hypothetical protein [Zunongwangia sp. F225]